MCDQQKFNKSKNPLVKSRFFDVDPAGLEPAFALTKGAVLPYELQARVHEMILKQKKPLIQGLPLLVSAFVRNSYEHRLICL